MFKKIAPAGLSRHTAKTSSVTLRYRTGSPLRQNVELDEPSVARIQCSGMTVDYLDLLTKPHKSRSWKAVPAPTFKGRMDLRIRRRRLADTVKDCTTVSTFLSNKALRDGLLDRLKLPTPRRLARDIGTAETLRLIAQHDQIVVKPMVGAGSKGVYLLERYSNGWRELRAGRTLTLDELRHEMDDLRIQGRPVVRWSSEELLRGSGNRFGHPMDYKLYMFQDQCGLIHQVRRQAGRAAYRYYDGDWSPVDIGRDYARIDDSMPLPPDRGAIRDLCSRVASLLPLTFIRVDVIQCHDGLRLGEVAPLPGRYETMSREMQRRLGVMWEQADFMYGNELASARSFRPALRHIRKATGIHKIVLD